MKSNRLWEYAAFAGLLAVALAAAFAAGYLTHARAAEPSGDFPVLVQVRDILRQNFLGEMPDDQALTYGAAHGMVGALNDPYSRFVEPPVHELESNDLAGHSAESAQNCASTTPGRSCFRPTPTCQRRRRALWRETFCGRWTTQKSHTGCR